MNDLAHLDDLVAYQDRGAELIVKHPVTGESMPDVVLIIAGPDSDTAKRARLAFEDAKYAFKDRPTASDIDRMYIDFLAGCIVGWRLKRDGSDVPFSFSAAVAVLQKYQFIREQVEQFANSRTAYFLRVLPKE